MVFSKAKGLPIFNQVLFPRTKGFIATVGSLIDSHIKAVYDLTLCYLHTPTNTIQKAPDMIRLHTHAFEEEYKFHVHVRRYEMRELPVGGEEMKRWLVERFMEKDLFISRMSEKWLENVELIEQ